MGMDITKETFIGTRKRKIATGVVGGLLALTIIGAATASDESDVAATGVTEPAFTTTTQANVFATTTDQLVTTTTPRPDLCTPAGQALTDWTDDLFTEVGEASPAQALDILGEIDPDDVADLTFEIGFQCELDVADAHMAGWVVQLQEYETADSLMVSTSAEGMLGGFCDSPDLAGFGMPFTVDACDRPTAEPINEIQLWVAVYGDDWLEIAIDPIIQAGADAERAGDDFGEIVSLCLDMWLYMTVSDGEAQTIIDAAPRGEFRNTLRDLWDDYYKAMDHCSDGDIARALPYLGTSTEAMNRNGELLTEAAS